MILQPQEYFTIVRQLGDPNDATTYYVRAVIRNSRTDALIATIDLTDQGSRRFSLPWQVPADPSGQGFYISVLTTVYTDAGHTTKSDNYFEEMETYLVDNRFRNLGGGGGGDGVDYKKIREIFVSVLRDVFFDKEDVFRFMPDFSPLIRLINSFGLSKLGTLFSGMMDNIQTVSIRIDDVGKAIQAIDIPKYEKPDDIDFTPVLAAIEAAKPEETEPAEPIDFSPLTESLQRIEESLKEGGDVKKLFEFTKLIKELAHLGKDDEEKNPKPKEVDYVSEAHRIMGINPKK